MHTILREASQGKLQILGSKKDLSDNEIKEIAQEHGFILKSVDRYSVYSRKRSKINFKYFNYTLNH